MHKKLNGAGVRQRSDSAGPEKMQVHDRKMTDHGANLATAVEQTQQKFRKLFHHGEPV